MSDCDRLLDENYLPTDEDILHANMSLTGLTKLECAFGERKMYLFEPGGSRDKRSKWIHFLDDCTAVFFLVAINEYDQYLLEDNNAVSIKM